jgi:hypothetical protein
MKSLPHIMLLAFALLFLIPGASSFDLNYDMKALYCQNEQMSLPACLKYWAVNDEGCPPCEDVGPDYVNPMDYYPDGYDPSCEKSFEWLERVQEHEIKMERLRRGDDAFNCPACPSCEDCGEVYTESDCRQDIAHAVSQANDKCDEENKAPWYFAWILVFVILIVLLVVGFFVGKYFIKPFLKKKDLKTNDFPDPEPDDVDDGDLIAESVEDEEVKDGE